MATQSLEFKSGLDDSKFQAGLKNMEKGAKASTGKISGMMKGIGIMAAAMAAINAGKAVMNMGGELDDQAGSLNMNVETMQKLQGVMLQSGVGQDQFVMGMKELGEAMVAARNEGGPALEKFEKLGISFEQIDDVGNDTAKMFYIMSDAIMNSESALDATTAATAILGGKQGKMVAGMRAGSKEIKKQAEGIEFLTAEEVEYTARLGDATEQQTNNLKKQAASAAAALANKLGAAGGMKDKVEPPNLGPGAKRRENPDDVKKRLEAEKKGLEDALKLRKEALQVAIKTNEENLQASQEDVIAAREALKDRLSGKREAKETTKEKRVNRMIAELENPKLIEDRLKSGKLGEGITSYKQKSSLETGGIGMKTKSLSTKSGVGKALSALDKAKEAEKANAANLKNASDMLKLIEKGINGG
jgi:hypothetical protein